MCPFKQLGTGGHQISKGDVDMIPTLQMKKVRFGDIDDVSVYRGGKFTKFTKFCPHFMALTGVI